VQGGKGSADYALAIGAALLSLCVAVFVVWLGARFTRKNMDRQWAREDMDRDRRWEEQRAHDRALFDLRERRAVYTNAIKQRTELSVQSATLGWLVAGRPRA